MYFVFIRTLNIIFKKTKEFLIEIKINFIHAILNFFSIKTFIVSNYVESSCSVNLGSSFTISLKIDASSSVRGLSLNIDKSIVYMEFNSRIIFHYNKKEKNITLFC